MNILHNKQSKAVYVVYMMNETHRDYWEAFNRLGNEKLHQHGFLFELLPDYPGLSEWFRMKLTRGSHEYLLFFSSHHLDFQDVVKVEENGQMLLPSPEKYRIGQGLYGYTDQLIINLIDDLCRIK